MENYMSDVWGVMLELAPWLLLGLIVAALMHVLIPAGLLARHLRGKGGVVKAVALGVPLPLCSCGVIPAGLGLKKDGASSGSAIGFLIATPQTGVDSIFVSASMLGWPFALLKVVAALVSGLFGGLLVERAEAATAGPASATPATHPTTSARGLSAGWHQAVDILRSIWGWLAVGILISAALTALLPDGALDTIFGDAPLLAALTALAISLPLYVCATGSVPIAAALVAAGLPLGAALIFLMAGPATNVATIGAVRRTFGGRATIIYLATIVGGSLGFGLLFDTVLAPLVSGGPASHLHHTHGANSGSPIEMAAAALLALALLYFAVEDVRRRLAARTAPTAAFDRALTVDGMTCQNCVISLDKALHTVPGVDVTRIDLASGQVRVRFTAGSRDTASAGGRDAELRRAIEDAGYDVRALGPDTPDPAQGAACHHDHHDHGSHSHAPTGSGHAH